MKQASVPATRALIPNPATSLLRAGATPARPPIRIAMLPKFENPHRVHVRSRVSRACHTPGTDAATLAGAPHRAGGPKVQHAFSPVKAATG
jgi:hypothetical protein